MPADIRHSKTPALRGLLEGCKEYALRDYDRRGNDRKVVEDFCQSLVDALDASGHSELKKDVALTAMIRKLRLDSGAHFESDVTGIVKHLESLAR